jgi:hypothetical protein
VGAPTRTPRTRKALPALVVRASFVSQETSFALLGVVGRKFLEVLVPQCRGVTRLGRTVLVELEEAEHVLRKLAVVADEQTKGTDTRDDSQLTSVDDVLARVGVRRAGGRVAR